MLATSCWVATRRGREQLNAGGGEGKVEGDVVGEGEEEGESEGME